MLLQGLCTNSFLPVIRPPEPVETGKSEMDLINLIHFQWGKHQYINRDQEHIKIWRLKQIQNH